MLVNAWRFLESQRELVLEVIRLYLGAGLLFRGIALLGLDTGLEQLAGGTVPDVPLSGLTLIVMAAHILGGALILIGFYTRLGALIQIPVLFGAVFLVHLEQGLATADQSLEFSALVLYLIILVFLFGGGRWSLDARLRGGS